MSSKQDLKHSHLLAALLDTQGERSSPHLELVAMKLGDAPIESGDKQQYVYFPTTSIISLHYLLENGGSVVRRKLPASASCSGLSSMPR